MDEGYAICLNKWIFDPRIKNELNFLLYISSLTTETGYCYASNGHLAEKFGIHEVNVSRKLKKLSSLGIINMQHVRKDRFIISREIFIVGGKRGLSKTLIPLIKNANTPLSKTLIPLIKNANTPLSKTLIPLIKNAKDNNTSINNTSNNIKEIFQIPDNEQKSNRAYLAEKLKTLGWIPAKRETWETYSEWFNGVYGNTHPEKLRSAINNWFTFWNEKNLDGELVVKNWKTFFVNTIKKSL